MRPLPEHQDPGQRGPRGPYETPGPGAYGTPGRVAPPKNWFVESILATLCCCLPLGIVAIVFAAKVEGQANRGDYQGAVESANKAKMFVILAVVIGILSQVGYFALMWPEFKKEFDKEMEKARMEQQQENAPPELTFPTEIRRE